MQIWSNSNLSINRQIHSNLYIYVQVKSDLKSKEKRGLYRETVAGNGQIIITVSKIDLWGKDETTEQGRDSSFWKVGKGRERGLGGGSKNPPPLQHINYLFINIRSRRTYFSSLLKVFSRKKPEPFPCKQNQI